MTRVTHHRASVTRLSAGVLLVLGARAGAAQEARASERESPHLRHDCRLAAQVLETGHPAPHSTWALETIGWCEESAGPALAALWIAPPSSIDAMEELYRASAHVRDGRVFDACARVAENAGAPTIVRLSALRVLAAYVDPGAVVPLEYLMENDPGVHHVASRDHATQIDGAVPLEAEVRAPVRALLLRLSGDSADPAMRGAAAYLVRRLALH